MGRIRSAFVADRLLPGFSVLRHRDFRILWVAAFVSFTGSQVQTVVQGDYVWRLTHDNEKLAFVTFCNLIPGTFLFPFIGIVVDLFDKRWVLALSNFVMGVGALYLATAATNGTLSFVAVALVSLVAGLAQTTEMPARQGTFRNAVGDADLPKAIPLQAMTFNFARVVGPALGGVLAKKLGTAACFYANAVSFVALVWAAFAVKPVPGEKEGFGQPIKDLIFEGVLYTFRDGSLRTIFFMEAATSLIGMPYMAQMPAIVTDMLHGDQQLLGAAYSAVGIGALAGLLLLQSIAHLPHKALVVRSAMACFSVGLLALAVSTSTVVTFLALAVTGASAIMQFNTTNTLFQLLSPTNLRGRVLSMHFWALAGLAPIGTWLFGWAAKKSSLPTAMVWCAALMGLATMAAYGARKRVVEPQVVVIGAE